MLCLPIVLHPAARTRLCCVTPSPHTCSHVLLRAPSAWGVSTILPNMAPQVTDTHISPHSVQRMFRAYVSSIAREAVSAELASVKGELASVKVQLKEHGKVLHELGKKLDRTITTIKTFGIVLGFGATMLRFMPNDLFGLMKPTIPEVRQPWWTRLSGEEAKMRLRPTTNALLQHP